MDRKPKPSPPSQNIQTNFAEQLTRYAVLLQQPQSDGSLHSPAPSGWMSDLYTVVNALNGTHLWSFVDEVPGDKWFGDYDQKLRNTPPLLQEIVQAWWASGPNLAKFRQDHPALCADLEGYWQRNPVELFWANSGGAAFMHGVMNHPGSTPTEEALRLFLLLITNPLWKLLAGPCARCGQYYIKKRKSQKVYCSRRCGNTATAIATSRERRKEEHADKLRRAAEAIHKFSKTTTKMGWKEWVSGREPGITTKFLTRAVNKRELTMPVRRSNKEK